MGGNEMAVKKSSGKKGKGLPTWASVVVIVMVLAAVAVWYTLRPGREPDWRTLDPEGGKMEAAWMEKCKNIDFFIHHVSPDQIPGLVDRKKIPPEWAAGNYVPYYDPAKKAK
jgi:hypothetical protein